MSQVEEDQEKYLKQATIHFKESLAIGKKFLDPLNSSYLNTVSSYSRFLLTFLNSKEEGVNLLNSVLYSEHAKKVFNSPNSFDSEIFGFLDEMKKFSNNIK